MDIKIFGVTFASILLAELADKTQLIGITLTAKSGRPFSVYLGSVLGYMLITLLSVVIGVALSRCVRVDIIKYAGGIIFILIGLLMLAGKI